MLGFSVSSKVRDEYKQWFTVSVDVVFSSSSSSSSDRTLSKSLKLSERCLGERDAWEREIKLCSNMFKTTL